jgi:hypothetical protein
VTATRPQRGLSRRQFLPAAAGVTVAGVAGLIGYELPHGAHGNGQSASSGGSASSGASTSSSAPATTSPAARSFITRPDLHPPSVTLTRVGSGASASMSPRFIFLAPTNDVPGGPAQQGLMVLDRDGRLVWFAPVTSGKPFDLNAQFDHGRPVLTWWAGEVTGAHGLGTGEVADSAYRTIGSVHAGGGLMTDLHELTLTANGTALITAYETTTTDLSSLGGPRQGRTFVGHAQEIDLATGKVLFDWNSLQHVGVGESYQPLPQHGDSYDYFHINSVAECDDGNLLISGRNTWAVYKVDRSTGRVLWRLNGKRSDFSLAATARFSWQHDARPHGTSAISVFDNAGPKQATPSRGVLLSVDEGSKRVELTQAYVHPAAFLVDTQGNMQRLPDGRVFVGWGDQPYFSEFAADGSQLLDGQLPFGVRSYRAFTADWVGHPADLPRVVAQANPAGGFVVYASWNGATEVSRWAVLAGADRSSLSQVGSQPWTGFETAIAVNSTGPYFRVVALDTGGNELGRSEIT